MILGAGLDTFVQRRSDFAAKMRVFEVDQPGPQAWKRGRLVELGFGVPEWLRLVPVNFEGGDDWWEKLVGAGFDASRPAVVASTGVSMYITKEAIAATLRQCAALAAGSTFAMTFLLPIEYADPELQPILEQAVKGSRESGTPFFSFFTAGEMLALRATLGFKKSSMCRRPPLRSGILQGGRMDCGRRIIARSFWWERRREGRSGGVVRQSLTYQALCTAFSVRRGVGRLT